MLLTKNCNVYCIYFAILIVDSNFKPIGSHLTEDLKIEAVYKYFGVFVILLYKCIKFSIDITDFIICLPTYR